MLHMLYCSVFSVNRCLQLDHVNTCAGGFDYLRDTAEKDADTLSDKLWNPTSRTEFGLLHIVSLINAENE